jgi:hypothetical protein
VLTHRLHQSHRVTIINEADFRSRQETVPLAYILRDRHLPFARDLHLTSFVLPAKVILSPVFSAVYAGYTKAFVVVDRHCRVLAGDAR